MKISFLNQSKKKRIWPLVVFSSFLRMLPAALLELGNDEVYYREYALHLQWNYFDHPPMVALLIRLSTFNLHLDHELFIRLGSILCAGFSTLLIYRIGCLIRNESTGWIAAVLFTSSFYSSVIAGTFILPDAPEVLFWLLSIYGMIRVLEPGERHKICSIYFIFLGVTIGLCTMSKIHGLFLWIGFGGYILFHRRDLLRNPFLWLSAIITLFLISPIYFWNLGNHFITYQYHQARIVALGRPDPGYFLQQLFGSMAYANPVNFILYAVMLYALIKRRMGPLPGFYPLFLWLSFPLIGILLWISLFNETLPHWSGPAYLSIMLMTALYADHKWPFRIWPPWVKAAFVVYCITVIFGTAFIRFLPFPFGSKDQKTLGKGDISLDMSGWRDFAIQFDSLYRQDLREGRMKPSSAIISDYWFPASHLDHYIALPNHLNLLAIGPLHDIHQFAWLNERRPRLTKGTDAYFIYPSNYYGPPKVSLKGDFASVEDSIVVPQYKLKKRVRNFVIYRMHDYIGSPADYLIPGIR
ncbi:MAG: glycosyltransferase family 39 protein [Puia sp.]